MIYPDNAHSMGRTPLVQLHRVIQGHAKVLAKIEGRNPSYSVKCRIGAAMIWDAEEKGWLKPGMEIIEPTSGNTGIALAYVAASKGYALTLTMPETMSIERRKILKAFGAKMLLTEGALGMKGAVEKAQAMVQADPKRYFMPQQFNNPANPAIHERTTGPEIWQDTDGQADILIAGVGTGGTITGISRYFEKIRQQPLYSVAVEPLASPILTQYLRGEPLKPGPHLIQGIGAGFIPQALDLSFIDAVETVSNEDALLYARRLAQEEGILAGISSGAAVAVADRLSQRVEWRGKTMVVILPDSGERYLSTKLFEHLEDVADARAGHLI